jgi:hypothetical protein
MEGAFNTSRELKLGVSTWSGFSVFGQNQEPEPGYPGSLFWETGTGTGVPVTGRFRFYPVR